MLIDTLKLDNKWAAYCNKILNAYDIPIHLLHESIIPYADILQKFLNNWMCHKVSAQRLVLPAKAAYNGALSTGGFDDLAVSAWATESPLLSGGNSVVPPESL